MEREEKELLKDLCARLPYGVMMGNKTLKETSYRLSAKDIDDAEFDNEFDDIPYLRPLSSMTEEEKHNILKAWNIKASFVGSKCDAIVSDNTWWGGKDKSEPLGFDSIPFKYMSAVIEWLNEHHFDYRGLIPMGLALEAPEGMYEI